MFVNVDGARIHFSDSGEGAPVLFLHGIPDSCTVWDGVIPTVSQGHRCLAPDLPGFGQSAEPHGFRVNLENMARFIDGFLDALGITEPIHLVVHDIGGPYGLAWAVRHPDRVRSIAIMNTVFQSEYRWHRYGRICRTRGLGELLQLLTSQSGLARAMRQNSGANKPSRAHVSATYRAFTGRVRRMVLRLYRGLDPEVFEGWDASLRALSNSVPSLVMWGDRDTYIGSVFADRFGARQVMHFPESGHWLMLEAPEVVSRRLLALFAEEVPCREAAAGRLISC
ncbi:alpha/beta fold hydrolase [Noviherbaspirillum galbum]|uniref:Alpha/beta fold hydrolase n=1 Tax=Noviherbaspirillum galbum TaxID=2709383 RepID=A0A6B3SNR2_9BURK|nr:alpha/beta fold hydrolase [Noviherbaspirillum galbum]NEX62377.1 alpha/beta fold hydrolase [Noviherbaspirillum galbum]